MAKPFHVLAALVALLCAGGSPALAQVQTGSILVRSVDEQGAVLPGVRVTISSPAIVAGQMFGVTDGAGVYRFPSLSPGVYSVKVELPGFQTVIRENVVASLGQTTTVDLMMRVATLEETVTVSGESPVVDTTSAGVNYNMTQQILQGTPGGRDIWSLLEYKVPGLVMSRPDVGGAEGGSREATAHAARSTARTCTSSTASTSRRHPRSAEPTCTTTTTRSRKSRCPLGRPTCRCRRPECS
ncbi:MAG: carboxypeptidase-like regulatory domain-containing protein [Vicinamibacterales bacterium]